MKIRHPLLIRMAGWSIAWWIRLWISTVRYRFRMLGPGVNPFDPQLKEKIIYAFWHEVMMVPAYHYGKTGAHVMISDHADGEMVAGACRYLGLGVVRGSTTRGSLRAMRSMLAKITQSHLVITPDGPRGPRQRVQPGVVYLAARTGQPIVPVGFACKSAWRVRSWDRFVVPRPFTDAVGVLGKAIHVPRDADKEQLEFYRQYLEDALEDVMTVAEEMVQGGGSDRQTGKQNQTISAGPPLANGEERCEAGVPASAG
jgi:lysophospholipid acyltransferase (LPLAT)-like uncharacterized protein